MTKDERDNLEEQEIVEEMQEEIEAIRLKFRNSKIKRYFNKNSSWFC